MLRIALKLLLILVFAGPMFAQISDTAPAATTGVTEVYLAKDDGTGQAGEEATSFVTTDVPIYCVVLLDSASKVTVRMNLVAVAVPGVKADTRVVSTTYTTREAETRVNFSGRPAGQWVPGRYRVDIFVGDQPVIRREFAIQKATQAKPVSKPVTDKTPDRSPYAGSLDKP